MWRFVRVIIYLVLGLMLLGLFADGTLEVNNEITSILAFTVFAVVLVGFAWNRQKKQTQEPEGYQEQNNESFEIEITVQEDDFSEEVEEPETKTLSQQADPTQKTYFNDDLYGPSSDAYEIPQTVLSFSKPYDEQLLFSYQDSKGGQSRRTVQFKEYQFYDGHYLYGQCLLRRAGRTFNCEKMTDIINTETGEVIDNLLEHIIRFTETSPYSLVDKAFEEYEPICKAWYYIAAGTKRISKGDYEELCIGLNKLMDTNTIEPKHLESFFKWADPPSSGGFERSVGGIVRRFKDKVKLFLDVSSSIHKRHTRPNFAETAAMDFIRKRIDKG